MLIVDRNKSGMKNMKNQCSVDSLMLSLIQDAFEGHDVACINVAGAYLNAFIGVGEDTDLICDVCLKLAAFVTIKGNTKVLYPPLDRALYRCVQSALL